MTSTDTETPALNQRRWWSAAFAAVLVLMLVQGTTLAWWWQTPTGQPLEQAALLWRIDPNTASAAELELLPRIGPRLAAAIIEYRESLTTQPAFESADDLAHVKRIGPATVERLRPWLTLPEQAADQPEETP